MQGIELPETWEVIGHETSDMVARVIKGGGDFIEDYEEFYEAFSDYSQALKNDDMDLRENAYDRMNSFGEEKDLPDYNQIVLERILDIIEAAEDYHNIGEIGEVELGYVLSPFESDQEIARETGDRDIDISDYEPATVVKGDRSLLLVSNTMCKNWKDHALEGEEGRMTVEVETDHDFVYVEVDDNGPGFDEDYEPVSQDGEIGTGIPLAKYLAERAGGDLEEDLSGDTRYRWKLRKS